MFSFPCACSLHTRLSSSPARACCSRPTRKRSAICETLFQDSKDIARSIDYLETRPDIDRKRTAYMGVSMGGALGVNFVGEEDRFRALIMLDSGFYDENRFQGPIRSISPRR